MFGYHSLSNDVGQILQRGFSFPGGLSGLGNTDKNSQRHLDPTVAHFTSGMKMHFFACDPIAITRRDDQRCDVSTRDVAFNGAGPQAVSPGHS